MSIIVDHDDLLSRFDDLVQDGIINHANPEKLHLEENGFTVRTDWAIYAELFCLTRPLV